MSGGPAYVALGSSFAAGPGLRPRAAGSPRRAGRSAVNAAHLVARDLGADLQDVSWSGATIAQLRRGGPGSGPPQIAAVGPRTRIVTVTGGGNDVGYLPALTLASLPAALAVPLRARARLAELLDPDATRARFERLEEELRALVASIHEAAPQARVLLVGYLTILPSADVDTGPLAAETAGWGRSTAETLAAVSARVASETDAEFVDVGAASRGHSAWAAEPWTRRFHLTLRGGAAYHPNATGMRAVARQVLTALGDPPPVGPHSHG